MIGPNFLPPVVDASPNLSLPRLGRIKIEGGMFSCSMGYDNQVVLRSAGEAIERHLAFCDPDFYDEKGTLAMLEPDIKQWVENIIPIELEASVLQEHQYQLVSARRNNHDVLVPGVLFSLGKCADDDFFGLRDSSGAALHVDYEQAMQTSQAEYSERQALVSFWYYGHFLKYKKMESRDMQQYPYPLRGLFDFLLNAGHVYLIDISLVQPFYTVLAIFIDDSGKVHYAAGASSNTDFDQAITKSVLELYQTYILMFQLTELSENNEYYKNPDLLLRGYHSFNDSTIRQKFAFMLETPAVREFVPEQRFLNQITDHDLIQFEKEIVFFNRKKIFYIVTKSLHGFPRMTLSERDLTTLKHVEKFYGFTHSINNGPIPFA
ncbi:YcaO-like family protein [Acinetobacter sp. WZC-1]|uniref:YcaO-like family protein n=1 Tax=Acinetobacter sp. WZC-1 TaxID=3459034 RepID=UPI00403DEE68